MQVAPPLQRRCAHAQPSRRRAAIGSCDHRASQSCTGCAQRLGEKSTERPSIHNVENLRTQSALAPDALRATPRRLTSLASCVRLPTASDVLRSTPATRSRDEPSDATRTARVDGSTVTTVVVRAAELGDAWLTRRSAPVPMHALQELETG